MDVIFLLWQLANCMGSAGLKIEDITFLQKKKMTTVFLKKKETATF